MSDETQETTEAEVTESTDTGTPVPEDVEQAEQTEEQEAQTEETQEVKPDLVAEAQAEQKRLMEEIEALKTEDTNIFEQNAQLKVDLEDAKKLQAVASENAKLKAQLEDSKRNTLTDSMLKSGKITADMRGWADGLSFDQLQEFARHAPRRKTILDEKNTGAEPTDTTFEEWNKKISKSRIIS